MPQSGLKGIRPLVRWLPRFLRGDGLQWKTWGLYGLALVLAFLLFLISRQPISEVRLVGVPVEYIGIPAGLELTGDVPQTVSVRVRGPRDIVRGLPPTQLAVEASLSNKTAGDRMIQLRAGNVNLPDGVQVVRIEPLSLRLKLEPTLRKKVKVEPQLTLPDEGIDVYQVSVEPEIIEIEGPVSQVNNITSVKTESLPLKGRRERFSLPLEIELPYAGLRLIGNANVKLNVELGERLASRLLKAVPVKAVNAHAGITLLTKMVEVVVTGTLSDLEQLREAEVQAEVDLSKLPVDAKGLKPVIRLPGTMIGRVNIKTINPTEVKVKR